MIKAKIDKHVAPAHALTAESHDLLLDCQAVAFTQSDFYWTDETIRRVKER